MLNNKSECGFSLIELLVATAILGVAVAPLVSGIVQSWRVSLEATRQTRAIMLSQWKLEQQLAEVDFANLQDRSISNCQFESYVPTSDGNFECEVDVEDLPQGTNNFETKEISVTIHFDSVLTSNRRTIQCSDVNNCNRPDRVTYRTKVSGGT